MKLRIAVLLFAVVALLSAVAGARLLGWIVSTGTAEGPSAITEASTRDETGRATISYRLDTDRWTTFTFPEAVDALRILSHADVTPDSGTTVGDTFRYGIEIEILNASGEVLRSTERFFRTELVIYTDARDGAQVTARRYSDDPGLPLAVDRLVLKFADLPDATHARFRTFRMDPGLSGVNIRVYRPRPFTRDNTLALWERLALSEKKALSLGYVHGPEDITGPEREAILSNRWIPFGPIGIEGRDYVSRKLEIYDAPGVRTSGRVLSGAGGVFLEPGRVIGLRLPERVSDLRLLTVPATFDSDAGEAHLRWPEDVQITVRMKPAGASEVVEKVVALDEDGAADLRGIDAGVVTLSADYPVLLKAIARTPGGSFRDLAADLPGVRYQVAHETALAYSIVHLGDAPTPFRFDLRCICDPASRPNISVRLLDDAGRFLLEEMVEFPPEISEYDRLSADPRVPVTEVASHFLSLSPEVARVEIRADRPVLVSAFARPVDVPRRYAIPEEYFAKEPDETDNRTWFPVLADGSDTGAVPEFFVELPARLSDDEDTVAPEALAWEQFTPEGPWVAREALVPRRPGEVGASAMDQFYTRLLVNRSTRARIAGEAPGETPRLRLLLLGEGVPSGEFRIAVDGSDLWRRVTSVPARIELPALASGEREIAVYGPEDVEVLISNVADGGPGYLHRRLLRLAPGRAVFRVPKLTDGREVLSIGVFPSALSGGRGLLEARLAVPRPQNRLLDDWTVERRLFDIRFDPGPEGGMLLPSGDALGAERTMFFVLGADLPPGFYELEVASEIEGEALLLLSRTRLPDGRRLSMTVEEVRGE